MLVSDLLRRGQMLEAVTLPEKIGDTEVALKTALNAPLENSDSSTVNFTDWKQDHSGPIPAKIHRGANNLIFPTAENNRRRQQHQQW